MTTLKIFAMLVMAGCTAVVGGFVMMGVLNPDLFLRLWAFFWLNHGF